MPSRLHVDGEQPAGPERQHGIHVRDGPRSRRRECILHGGGGVVRRRERGGQRGNVDLGDEARRLHAARDTSATKVQRRHLYDPTQRRCSGHRQLHRRNLGDGGVRSDRDGHVHRKARIRPRRSDLLPPHVPAGTSICAVPHAADTTRADDRAGVQRLRRRTVPADTAEIDYVQSDWVDGKKTVSAYWIPNGNSLLETWEFTEDDAQLRIDDDAAADDDDTAADHDDHGRQASTSRRSVRCACGTRRTSS